MAFDRTLLACKIYPGADIEPVAALKIRIGRLHRRDNRRVDALSRVERPKRDAAGDPFLLLSPEQIGNLYFMDWEGFKMTDWTKKWNRTVAK